MQYFVTSTTENVCLQKKQLVVVGYEKAVYDIRKNSQLVWEADSLDTAAVSFRNYNSKGVIHTANKSSATAGFNYLHSYIPPTTWSLLVN